LGLFIAMTGLLSQASSAQSVVAPKATAAVLGNHLQTFFEPSDPRWEPKELYRGHGLGVATSFEQDTVRVLLPNRGGEPSSVQLHFAGALPSARVEGVEHLLGISNYFAGSDPKQWRTKVPHFARVAYRGVYPGVDVVFYGEQGRLEYDYVLAPDADPSAIHLHVEGGRLALSREGEVIVSAGGREVMRMKKPKAYQDAETRRLVAADYVLKGDEVTVQLGKYDHHRQLVVDPALAFATFLMADCGTSDPCGMALGQMVVDSTGIYMVGSTTASVFPSATGQPPATNTHTPDAFVMKLDPTGTKVIYQSLFVHGGFGAIAVDANGQAVVAGGFGDQPAGQPGFPLTPGSFNGHPPVSCLGCNIPVVTKLTSDGANLVFSTLLQLDTGNPNANNQTGVEGVVGIALDATGAVYVSGFHQRQLEPCGICGVTSLLPVQATPGAFLTSEQSGLGSAYIMKLNPAGTALDYSTFMGSPNTVTDFFIAVDANGAAYLTGTVKSDFPVTPGAFQATAPSGAAAVVKLHPDGKSLDYSTFFGDQTTVPIGIAVPASNEAIISGTGATVPTTGGAVCGTGTLTQQRAFAARLNSAGNGLVYSTTLCNVANASTKAAAMAMDSSGSAYVLAGAIFNSLPPSLFPLMNPIQSYVPPSSANTTTALFKLDSTGALQFGTFFGDMDFNGGTSSMAVDSAGAVYFLGVGDPETPTTPNALRQLLPSGLFQGTYLAKIIPSLGAPVPVLRTTLDFGSVAFGTSSAPNDAIVGNFGDATLPAPTASITGDFSQTSACPNPVPPGQNCAFTVTFTPTAAGLRTGTLTVHFSGGLPDQTMALSGTGLAPTATPSSAKIVFPPQFPLNTTSAPQQLKITNNGTFALNISNIQTTGDFAQTNTCSSVAIGAFCLVNVTFTPTANGVRNGTLTLTDNAVNSPQTVNLVGFGGQAPAVSLNPATIGFGNQNVGSTSAAAAVTLTNSGNQTLNVSQVAASGDFTQTNNCTSVSAGNTCTLQVSFAPTASGTRNGSVTVTSNSFTSPDVLPVTGVAVDFSATMNGSGSSTVTAGQTANYGLSVAPMNGFNGTLNFTCTGAPSEANCTVSPSSLTLNGSAQNVSITVTTTAASAAAPLLPGPVSPNLGRLAAGSMLLLLSAAMFAMRKRARWLTLAPLAFVLLWVGCGGGNSSGGGGNPGTPRGTYTIVVTGTGNGGSPSHATNFTLTVN
jgi:hypothetical protein